MKVLRMERLAPAVLLVLFDGVPAVVHIEEPRQGIQFGVRLDPDGAARAAPRQGAGARLQHRRPGAADRTTSRPTNSVDVPFRPGAPGVINMRRAARSGWRPRRRTAAARWSRTSTRCRCCASPTARCSATPTTSRGQNVLRARPVQGHGRAGDLEEHGRDQPGEGDPMRQPRRKPRMRRKGAPAAAARAFDAEAIRTLVRGKRFLAADRAALDLGEIATWDRYLLREHRLLVPIDVQALYVPRRQHRADGAPADAGGRRRRRDRSTTAEDGMPDPFDAGAPRAAGVHLHWAMPDALLRGTLQRQPPTARPTASRCRRCPTAGSCCASCCRAAAAMPVAHRLGHRGRPRGGGAAGAVERGRQRRRRAPRRPARRSTASELTGTVGGAVSWSGVYDAVLNRFAFHDPLADLATLAPQGVDEDCAAYVVAGWWSDPALDPLDKARSNDSLHELLDRLRWRLLLRMGRRQRWAAAAGAGAGRAAPRARADHHRPLVGQPRPVATAAPRARRGGARPSCRSTRPSSSKQERVAVVGVRQRGGRALRRAALAAALVAAARRDLRRAGARRAVARTGGRPRPALARRARPARRRPARRLRRARRRTPDQRRATERLLAAFTAQKVNRARLGRRRWWSSRSTSTRSPSRRCRRARPAPTASCSACRPAACGGLGLGRKRAGGGSAAQERRWRSKAPRGAAPRAQAQSRAGASMLFATKGKPTLVKASAAVINDLARSRVGEVLAPTEARVVRPAGAALHLPRPSRWWRCAARGRSLRHGDDGRGSADGKLTCRWPTHVITEISGVIAKDRFIRSLGNGAMPARGADAGARGAAARPLPRRMDRRRGGAAGRAAARRVLDRLKAESVLRFGARRHLRRHARWRCNPNVAKTPQARRAQAARRSRSSPACANSRRWSPTSCASSRSTRAPTPTSSASPPGRSRGCRCGSSGR